LHFRNKLVFNLKEVAWEHIGLSRNDDVANLKRKMLPGIQELETSGYLVPMDPKKRFRKIQAGTWEVEFQKAVSSEPVNVNPEGEARPDLIKALVSRAVTESVAKELVATVDPVQIEEKIEVFDWLRAQKDPKVMNPGGFLVASIRKNYEAPQDYETPEDRAKKEAEVAAKQQRAAAARQRKEAQEAAKKRREQRQRNLIDGYWKNMSAKDQKSMRTEVMETMDDMSKELIQNGSPMAETLINAAVRSKIWEILQRKGATE